MKLSIHTIVLDGLPFIADHLAVLESTALDWTWHISEGVSAPVRDTAWCRAIEPRLSMDGTKEYLDSISKHPRVRLYRKPVWQGKTEQINAGMGEADNNTVVLQMDSDEMWTGAQLEKLVRVFRTMPHIMSARFWCRFMVGPGLEAITQDGWSNRKSEWHRAWRGRKNHRFSSHEPPIYDGNRGRILDRDETKKMGLVFHHRAYELEKQLQFKALYYKYGGAVEQWRALNNHDQFPVPLDNFLSWVGPGVVADRIKS